MEIYDAFQGDSVATNHRFVVFRREQRDNEGMEQFFGAVIDLSRGCNFCTKAESIVWDILTMNMPIKEIRKHLCMETLSPADAVQFAVVKER